MKTDLIYGVEDRPPFKDALFAALQHLLAIFVAIITPPLIIASALKPVSYTHLDVYKRQEVRRMPATVMEEMGFLT